MSNSDFGLLTDATVPISPSEAVSLTFEPNLDFLNITTPLGLLNALSPNLGSQVQSLVESEDGVLGQITIDQGVVTTDFFSPEGIPQLSLDVPAYLRNWATLVATTNGALTLNQGFLNGSLTTDQGTLAVDNVNLATTLSTFTSTFLNNIEGTFPFANGQFAIDATTLLGPVTGTLGFGGGALSLNLNTPAGAIATAVDFGPDARIPFTVGSNTGTVDFDQGIISLPLLPNFDVTIPLDSLSGQVTLDQGTAHFAVDTVLGSVPIDVQFGPPAAEAIANLASSLDGTVDVTNGTLAATLHTDSGTLQTNLDLVALANQAATFAEQVSGSITLAKDVAFTALDTPLGPVSNAADLSDASTWLKTPLVDLV